MIGVTIIQLTFGDFHHISICKANETPLDAIYMNTEESVTDNDINIKEKLFYYKNENSALKVNIENLQNKLVELQECNDESVK